MIFFIVVKIKRKRSGSESERVDKKAGQFAGQAEGLQGIVVMSWKMNAITFPIHNFRSKLTPWQTQFIKSKGLNTIIESVEVSINALQF